MVQADGLVICIVYMQEFIIPPNRDYELLVYVIL